MTDTQRVMEYCDLFHSQREELYHNRIPDEDAASWMSKNIPLFECDDKNIEEAYYFRFWTFRKHIKDTPEGAVVTEFLPDVPWSGPYNTISCAVSHQISEGRWLCDQSIIKNDIRFFLKEEHRKHAMTYSSAFLWSVSQYCRHSGDLAFAKEVLPLMIAQYEDWEKEHMTPYGLFWSHDGYDGMELSISGCGLRPTLNTYMYGAACGIAALCDCFGDSHAAAFHEKAKTLRENIHQYLWDGKDGFYKVIPMDTMESKPDFNRQNESRNVMEEIGFIPFLIPTLTEESDEKAFSYLMDKNVFLAPYGITTADMRHPLFMKNPAHHECLWDGPVWPFATAQTLTSIYTLLSQKESRYITPGDYLSLLSQYAESQHRMEHGKPIRWIDENLDPFTGQWISRDLIYLDHSYHFPKERGADYNHSVFCDLVLSGACGILPDTDLRTGKQYLRIKPLCTGIWKNFYVKQLSFGGSVFEIYYDRDKNVYGYNSQLTLVRDGKVAASGDTSLFYEI